MLARFWGTRGSIASPGPATNHFGGNTSCVELTTPSGGILVLDCGTGARPLGNRLLASASGPISATVLLTHTHWDHIQGFPFFAPLFQPDNHFKVYGPEGAHLSLRDVLAGQMEHHYFPVELDQLAARISYKDLCEGTYEIDGLQVRAQQMNHPSPTLGYRVEAEGRSHPRRVSPVPRPTAGHAAVFARLWAGRVRLCVVRVFREEVARPLPNVSDHVLEAVP